MSEEIIDYQKELDLILSEGFMPICIERYLEFTKIREFDVAMRTCNLRMRDLFSNLVLDRFDGQQVSEYLYGILLIAMSLYQAYDDPNPSEGIQDLKRRLQSVVDKMSVSQENAIVA